MNSHTNPQSSYQVPTANPPRASRLNVVLLGVAGINLLAMLSMVLNDRLYDLFFTDRGYALLHRIFFGGWLLFFLIIVITIIYAARRLIIGRPSTNCLGRMAVMLFLLYSPIFWAYIAFLMLVLRGLINLR